MVIVGQLVKDVELEYLYKDTLFIITRLVLFCVEQRDVIIDWY